MVKPYTSTIAVSKKCAAISNISRTWDECWTALMNGESVFEYGEAIGAKWPQTAPLAMISARGGWRDQPPYEQRFRILAKTIADDMKSGVDELVARNNNIRIHVILATCHSDPGALSTLANYIGGAAASMKDEIWEMLLKNSAAQCLTEGLGRSLPVSTVSTACASALVGTSYAADMLNADLCDAVFLLAIDGMARIGTAGFQNIGAMTKDRCAPYDVNRTGITVGEGGVGFILAKEEFLAPEQVYGHISGTAVFCDAAHLVEPSLEGVREVLGQAMKQAAVAPEDLSGIYWHGTGTRQNDKTEALVSEMLFGAKSPPCTSTKGSLGHTMGVSGAYNVLAACETNACGKMVPVTSLKAPEYPNLDLVQGVPRDVAPGPILVTALGFGGINAAVVVTP